MLHAHAEGELLVKLHAAYPGHKDNTKSCAADVQNTRCKPEAQVLGSVHVI